MMGLNESYHFFVNKWECKGKNYQSYTIQYIDGLVQEKRNSIANALELRLSCTNPSTSYKSHKSIWDIPLSKFCFDIQWRLLCLRQACFTEAVAASLISPWILWWPPAESHYNIYDHSVVGYVSHAHCIVLLYSVGNKITTTSTEYEFWLCKLSVQFSYLEYEFWLCKLSVKFSYFIPVSLLLLSSCYYINP